MYTINEVPSCKDRESAALARRRDVAIRSRLAPAALALAMYYRALRALYPRAIGARTVVAARALPGYVCASYRNITMYVPGLLGID